MKNLTSKMMMAVATLALAGAASAQTLKADIPFAFQVGSKVMAPGSYLVSRNAGDGIEIFRLYNVGDKNSALSIPDVKHDPAKDWNADGKPRLAFECGSRCFLAEIYPGASSVSYKISHPKPRGEETRMAVVVAQSGKAD